MCDDQAYECVIFRSRSQMTYDESCQPAIEPTTEDPGLVASVGASMTSSQDQVFLSYLG